MYQAIQMKSVLVVSLLNVVHVQFAGIHS